MNPIPIITGIGLVSPLGNSALQTWEALLAGRHITSHAKVPLDFSGGRPRVSNLAIRAAREATSKVGPAWIRDAALVVGTSKGPVESWLGAPSTLSDVERRCSFGLSQVATDVAAALGLGGPRLTLSAACASGLHALIRGVMLIRSGEASRALIVAAEASVHPLFIGSFRRLGVLPAEGAGCRPFDRNRDGFLMSEAAAAVCLEAADADRAGIIVERYSMAADAAHLTGSSPDAQALRHVLRETVGASSVDVFHAHATGTVLNDAVELEAIEGICAAQASPPNVYSHKGALGHSLGAAGLVSIVINVLCHQHGAVPPNVQTIDPLVTANVSLSRSGVRRRIDRSIAAAAGFGGPVAAVALATHVGAR